MPDHAITPMMAHTTAIEVDRMLRRHGVIGPLIAERRCCFVRIVSQRHGEILGTLIGAQTDKLADYRKYSLEKIERVMRFNASEGHLLSRQSADEAKEMYPGAALGMHLGATTSGYPGLVDEIGSLANLCQLGDVSFDEVCRTMREHPNKYFDPADEDTQRLFRGGTH